MQKHLKVVVDGMATTSGCMVLGLEVEWTAGRGHFLLRESAWRASAKAEYPRMREADIRGWRRVSDH